MSIASDDAVAAGILGVARLDRACRKQGRQWSGEYGYGEYIV